MKKMFTVALLAIAGVTLAQQQALAWVHNRFSVGLTWDRSAAGNGFGWGLWRNGQVPAPYGGIGPYGPAPAPYASTPYGGGSFGGGGGAPYGTTPYMPSGGPDTHGAAPYTTAEPTLLDPSFSGAGVNYPSPYQFANYPRSSYYYPNTNYYYGR